MKKKKVVFAGTMLLDLVKIIDRWPDMGNLVNILSIKKAIGGCVCNSGIDLAVLGGVDVEAYGRVGNDDNGEFLKDVMKKHGVDVSHIVVSDKQTSFTDVMTIPTGERTFFSMRGAMSDFSIDDVDVDSLNADIFHLGYLLLMDKMDSEDSEYGTMAARLLHDVQAKGIKTSIDLVSDLSGKFDVVVPHAVKYCDYVVINEIEAGKLVGVEPRNADDSLNMDSFKIICEKVMDMGVKECVVIHCPELSCAMDKERNYYVLPSLQLPAGYIVGSVGAGDAFCAGMLYSFINDMGLMEGMRLASCCAAANLSVSDSISGARSYEETIKLDKKFERKKLC